MPTEHPEPEPGSFQETATGSIRSGGGEVTLQTEKIQIERKTFVFALKENPRGRFLRITEDVNGRRDTIIVPASGLGEFRRVLDDLVKGSDSKP